MLTVEMEGDDRITSWIGYGVLWGVIGLTNPSTLSFLPFAGCWLAYQLYRRGKRFVLPAVVAAVLFWMTMMPWLVRNYEVFHKPVFVRDNVGVEIRCGNNPLAEGIWVGMYHPSQNPILYRQYQEMGEAAYSAEQSRLAKQWIAENPKQFAIVTFRRFIFYWNGLPRLSKIQALEQFKNSLFLASSLLVDRRTRSRDQEPRPRRVPVCQPADLFPTGLLCKLPASPIPASHRSGTGDSWSLFVHPSQSAQPTFERRRPAPPCRLKIRACRSSTRFPSSFRSITSERP